MSSRASRRNDTTDIIKKLQNDNKRNQGLARQAYSGLASSEYGSSTSNSGGTTSSDAFDPTGLLKTAGDTMVGPLAFYPANATITDGYLSVALGQGYTSRLYVIGEGSVADDLEVILGASNAGQILFFQPIVAAITIQDREKAGTAWADGIGYNAGDVRTTGGLRYQCHTAHTSATATNKPEVGVWADYWYRNNIRITRADERVLGIDEIFLMQYDSTDGVWTVLSSTAAWEPTATSNLDMASFDIVNIGALNFDAVGAQITADAGATGVNFVTTSAVPFRFTPNTVNVLDIDTTGLSMLSGDIDLNNLNIIGVNALNFNETGQSITDSAGGLQFTHTDALDKFDFTTDTNLNMSIEKFFINMKNSRIQMTDEIAPGSPIATQSYIYVDSTSGELSILHSTGAAVSLESAGGTTSFIGFTGDDILDMADFDIERVGKIEFSSTSHSIDSNTIGFEFRVPVGDDFEYFVNGVSEMRLDAAALDVKGNNITNVGDIGFDVIGGQITADTGVTGMNFVTTSAVPFRFTANATNVVDITSTGLTMLGSSDIAMGNNDITGLNGIDFNVTGQSITDNVNGLRFNLPDAADTYDYVINGTTSLSLEKFFMDLGLTTIQLTEKVAPAAPAATEHYVYVDSTSKELTIKHNGSTVSLESGGSTSFIGFTGDDDLDMATFDIERVGQIEFSSTSHYIKSNSLGFEYRVPVGDDHDFFVNGVLEAKIDGGETRLYNDVFLGSSSADANNIYGLVDWKTNFSAVAQSSSTSVGYITIKVNGTTQKLHYF
jgi:hypothetical protein